MSPVPDDPPPEIGHLLDAAEGWLLLGRADEAAIELASVRGVADRIARFLDLRWQVAAAAGEWGEALRSAEDWMALAGAEDVSPWVQRSYALRRCPTGGLTAAFEALRPALDRFPLEPIVPYNLACYLAQSAQLDPAWELLMEAVRRGGEGLMVPMARADPDLSPLSPRIATAWPGKGPQDSPGPED